MGDQSSRGEQLEGGDQACRGEQLEERGINPAGEGS